MTYGAAGRGGTSAGDGTELTRISHDPAAYCLRTNRAASNPDASGTAVLGGVADGLSGGLTTSVGVGTGGSVSVGGDDGDTVALVAGTAPLGAAVAGRMLGGTDGGALDGLTGDDEYSTAVTGREVEPRAGAAPIPPAPPGALAADGVADGVASIQPTVTANGRPRATMPKKIDLGESRTHEHRSRAPKSYGMSEFRNFEMRFRSSRRLVHRTAGRS